MKKLFFLLFMISSVTYSQEKIAVSVQPVEVNDPSHIEEAKYLYDKIQSVFVESNRFSVLDRGNIKAVHSELENQKGVSSINAEVVDQGKIAGAEFLIVGKLLSLEYVDTENTAGKLIKVFTGNRNSKESSGLLIKPVFTYSLSLISVETSETPKSKNFSVSVTKGWPGLTNFESFKRALDSEETTIQRDFINEFLPEIISIVQIEKENGGKAEEVLISTGDANGTKKNDQFVVYKLSNLMIGDRETVREEEISQLRVIEVQGADLALAKVLNGEAELLEALSSGNEVICKLK
jgi:curli biogenesis system outer membrane secretion channel CsgG